MHKVSSFNNTVHVVIKVPLLLALDRLIKICFKDSPITPQLLHHVFNLLAVLLCIHLGVALGSKLGCIHFSKLLQSESPAMEPRAKAHSANHWGDL